MFDLPRETLVVILESPLLTAVDLARFACVSKKENSKQLAMEAAKNRVLKAWPESELNYKRNDDQVWVKPSEGRKAVAFGYECYFVDRYIGVADKRTLPPLNRDPKDNKGEDDEDGKKAEVFGKDKETWLDALRFLDGKLAEEREREKRRAQLRKKGLLLERDDYCADLKQQRRAIQDKKYRMNWMTTTCTHRDGRTEIWGTEYLCDEFWIGSTKMKARANEVFIGEDRLLYFKRFQSSALQSRRIRSLHEKHGKLIAPDFHWCAKQARKVLWVAIGTNHTVMLMESGEVYTFGKNKHGELGFANTVTEIEVDDFSERGNEDMMVDGNDTKPTRRTKILKRTTFEYRTPRLLGFIREEGEKNDSSKGTSAHPDSPDYISRRCRFISAKKHTSMVTTVDGLVFGFGKNDRGQLGIGNNFMQYQPRKITTFPRVPVVTGSGVYYSSIRTEEMKIKKAVCCGDHSVALSVCGMVFAFGSNQHFACGATFPVHVFSQLRKDQWYPRRIALTWCDNPPRNDQGKILACEREWFRENGLGTVIKDITTGWSEHDRLEIDEKGDLDEYGVNNLELSEELEYLIEVEADVVPRDEDLDSEINDKDDEIVYSILAEDISGGQMHTVILDRSGIVWTVGKNIKGACGRPIPPHRHIEHWEDQLMNTPSLINFVAKPVIMPTYTDEETGERRVVRMAEIHSGRYHLGAVAEKTGWFYGWGSIENGELGWAVGEQQWDPKTSSKINNIFCMRRIGSHECARDEYLKVLRSQTRP